MDVALEAAILRGLHNAPTWFQSLFSWMLRSKIPRSLLVPHSLLVSILVLVDVALEEHKRRFMRDTGQVSILVLVDVALEDGYFEIYFEGRLVSILVLVDVALEAGSHTRSRSVGGF